MDWQDSPSKAKSEATRSADVPDSNVFKNAEIAPASGSDRPHRSVRNKGGVTMSNLNIPRPFVFCYQFVNLHILSFVRQHKFQLHLLQSNVVLLGRHRIGGFTMV